MNTNTHARNKLTGEIKKAFDCDQTCELYDEHGNILGAEWETYLTPQEKRSIWIVLGLCAVSALTGLAFMVAA